MKRLYLLIPDIENASAIAKALRKMGVGEGALHIIVKEDQDKIEMAPLLEAGVFATTDLLKALIRGGILGGIAGLIAGILIVKFPPEEFVLGNWTIIALTVFGVLFGAWSSSLIGISVPNPMMEKLESAVAAGGIMFLVDVPEGKEVQIMDYLRLNHPETSVHGANISQPPISGE